MTAEPLTAHQVRCLAMLADGLTAPQIAAHLHITPRAAASHIELLRERLNARNAAHAVAIGYRTGLLTLEDA